LASLSVTCLPIHINLKRYTNLLFALASSLLLWACWPVSPFTFFVFVAWIPLLWLESVVKSRRRFFAFTYLAMFVWNVATTWWIWNASPPGAVSAFLANSLLMCLPWLGYKIAKNRLGETVGYISLVAFWMCFEYIHLQDWGLSWPWLTLGNVFATHPEWVQWYEYTGTSGGSLWIWIVNILLFLHVKTNFIRNERKTYSYLLLAVLVLVFPITLSILTGTHKTFGKSNPNIVIVQPNIDPYEKISTGTFDAQLQQLISLSEQQIDTGTTLVVWPETALYMDRGLEETEMNRTNYFLNPLWAFLQRHPKITLFTGVESYRSYDSKKTSTARPMGSSGYYYDAFNGSALMDSSGAFAFYHKSMLVPGVETLPWFLKFIDSWFAKFGGTTAGYARQKERTVLHTKDSYIIAPSICYESIYGEFMSKYIRNGANLICIITNDGWWKNTPGHKQHMNYARLRAIETRTWIARSANTGISCFIDPYGAVIDPQPYDTDASIKRAVPAEHKETFYVKYGDLASKGMVIAALSILIWTIVHWARHKWGKKTVHNA
jgi:apolipoprotein N-acyltransferase